MENHVRGHTAGEFDTDALFQKYTIDEIRDIEKKTRNKIEHKKEELRQMVGERYRDLIEAADTITDMKNSANNVMQTISKMQELCQGMKKSFQPQVIIKKPAAIDRQKDEKPHYGIAAQIKVLLDTPEKIWSALDSEEYLLATCIFLLARHINTSLSLDTKQSSAILSFFPVLNKQWATISHFRNTILQDCRDRLKTSDVSSQVIAECLCSILLLEDSTPRQVFNELLLSRTTAVEEQLRSDSSRVQAQICHVMHILTTTLHQIYTLFYSQPESSQEPALPSNLLLTTLKSVTEKNTNNSVVSKLQITSVSKKYLPEGVQEFRPVPRNQANAIDQNTIQNNSQEWIDTCIKSVNNGVGKLLGFIDSVKSLASIRDQIWTMLKEDKHMDTWDMVCERIISRKLPLWEQFLKPLFLNRAKLILETQMEATLGSCKAQVGNVLAELANMADRSMNNERDLSSYVWCESSTDLPPDTAWVPLNARTLLESGALVMKARAFTPAVQSLCRNVDKKLKALQEDSNFYIGTFDFEEEKVDDKGPFDRFADKGILQLFLQETCDKCIAGLMKHLQTQLYAFKQQLINSGDVLGNKIIIDRILLMARFATGLSELSLHLQKCIVFEVEKKQDKVKRPSPYRGQPKAEDPKWAQLKDKLLSFSQESYSAWIKYTCKVLLAQFESGLLDSSGGAVLHSLTKWDAIEIEEETEEGKSVKSTIRVPMQASWYVQALLYNVCEEINRIGGHALHRSTLTDLANQLSDGMLDAYPKLFQNQETTMNKHIPLTQNRALQIWFDVKFLSNIFPRKEDTQENRDFEKKTKAVLESAEAVIDPFDLDVFSPYMGSNLLKHTQRCQVLYGALVSLDSRGMVSGYRAPSSGQQEQHNVLALTCTTNRFPLLPISGQSKTSSAIVEPPKPKTMTRTSSSSGPVASIPNLREQPKSFLGQVSNMWFSQTSK